MTQRLSHRPSLPDAMAAMAAVAVAVLLAGPVPAAAADAPAQSAAKPAAPAAAGAPTAPGAAMKAYVDPKTGQFVSSPPEGTPSLSVTTQAPVEPAVEERLPGGGYRSRVPRRLMHFMTMTVAPDGTASTRCNQGPAHTERTPDARPQAKEVSREK